MYDLKASKKKHLTSETMNKTGIPVQLKKKIEQNYNLSLDNVWVHYNSQKPNQLHAYAYTQGTHVYISPAQEKHLPHELGHVIQQMNGVVKPTFKLNGINVNNNPALEHEADLLGSCSCKIPYIKAQHEDVAQCFFCDSLEADKLIDELVNINTNPPKLKEYDNKLNTQGIINGTIEYSGHDNRYILYKNGSPLMFPSAKELCDFLKQRIKNNNNNEQLQITSGVPFGNEFTFRNSSPDFNFNIKDLSFKDNPKPKAAEKFITCWTELAPQKITCNGITYTKVIGDGNKKWTSANYTAKMVTYSGYDQTNWQTVSWKFNIDLDPNCIEIQTQPLTFEAYQNLTPLIKSAIFDTAAKLKLIADINPDTGGGSHISLDTVGAFQGNAHYLRNFLVAYVNEQFKPGCWVYECNDTANAPFIHELGGNVVRAFKKTIEDFDVRPVTEQTIDTLINIIQKNVYHGHFMPQLADALEAQQGGKKLSPELAYHYQAVNLEHMRETDGTAHIEMRRYNAQTSTSELCEQLNHLWELLLRSRQKQNIPLSF